MRGFPDDFVWGAATAAYQIEGAATEDGRGPSIWDTFADVPGAVVDGSNGDVADDHYHRYAEDIALLAELGLKAYRFSIAWSRRAARPAAARSTRRASTSTGASTETCHAHGVTPYATLYHWDLPQPLEDAGGWLNRATAERFRDYAVTTVGALSDVITRWTTLNEPWCSSLLGYGAGVHAPGRTLGSESLHAAHHLLLGHGLAVAALPRAAPGAVARHHGEPLLDPPGERLPARRRGRRAAPTACRTGCSSTRCFRGSYPADVLEDTRHQRVGFVRNAPTTSHVIATPVDFLGVNYYRRHHRRPGPRTGTFGGPGLASSDPGSERIRYVDPGPPRPTWAGRSTPTAWYDVHRDGPRPRLPARPAAASPRTAPRYADMVEADGTVADLDRAALPRGHVDACREALRGRADAARLLRLEPDGQLRVGVRLHEAVRHRLRRLRTQLRTVKASGAGSPTSCANQPDRRGVVAVPVARVGPGHRPRASVRAARRRGGGPRLDACVWSIMGARRRVARRPRPTAPRARCRR